MVSGSPSSGFNTTTDEVLAGRDLGGLRVLVTGASGGLGLETARALAAHGASVTLACRDPEKGQRAAAHIEEAHPGAELSVAALDLLDQALVIAPHYPEAWNRRATLNFSMNRLGKSLVDIEQTLLREPRHWGALMGLAMILEQTGRKEQALETYLRVLAVYPALDSAQDAAGRLSEELLGPAI